jgi:3-methyladenine DNA glycosylase Tag
MQSFAEIRALAEARHGASLMAGLPELCGPEALARLSDADILAQMAKCIFQTGISWQVVEAKWPGISAAFHDFRPARVALIEGDELHALLQNPAVIRSGAKITAIRDNAVWMTEVARTHGSFAARIAAWPPQDHAGLLLWMAREGKRLGGNTGAYVLRFLGKEGFMLSPDVGARLKASGVISGPPTSARALAAIQSAFNQWQAESGLSLTAISRILAKSIDA